MVSRQSYLRSPRRITSSPPITQAAHAVLGGSSSAPSALTPCNAPEAWWQVVAKTPQGFVAAPHRRRRFAQYAQSCPADAGSDFACPPANADTAPRGSGPNDVQRHGDRTVHATACQEAAQGGIRAMSTLDSRFPRRPCRYPPNRTNRLHYDPRLRTGNHQVCRVNRTSGEGTGLLQHTARAARLCANRPPLVCSVRPPRWPNTWRCCDMPQHRSGRVRSVRITRSTEHT